MGSISSSRLGVVPMTPVSFLKRARAAFGDRCAVIGPAGATTYSELASRCERMAGGLAARGVRPGDVVSVLAPNTRLALEAHFGVPMAGAVLNALNIRLSASELAYIVSHAGARVLIFDAEFEDVADAIRAEAPGLSTIRAGGDGDEYEAMLAQADPLSRAVDDELALLALNYTSGTTGRPKGVMYAHRGAYLQALAMAGHCGLSPGAVFLWTLPMFHCNGWCFPWAVTASGATHVELRRPDPPDVWRAIRELGITHLNAAPTVLTAIANSPAADEGPAPRIVQVMTGGAPPSPSLLARMSSLNFAVRHLYGLTETYGPAVLCEWQPEWDDLDAARQAVIRARQGIANLVNTRVRVVDERGDDVAADGATMGEVILTGNTVMLGYFRDEAATEAVTTADGWLRTGDVGVIHPDGYVELRDRAKDVIISGGENIASIEIEQCLAAHPDVLECAVVAAPDEHWGEVPVAYVDRRPGSAVTPDELIAFVKDRIARFKAPKRITFMELPKTATGKIQKFVLRDLASSAPPDGGAS